MGGILSYFSTRLLATPQDTLRPVRLSVVVRWITWPTALCLLATCGSQKPAQEPAPAPFFEDQTSTLGLDFVHFNGMSGEMYFSEVVGSGSAFFDADNDGDLDLYLVQGSMLGPGKTLSDALSAPRHEALHDRFYRNLLIDEGSLRFVDATAGSGLEAATGYGMGVSTGDFDNDGLVDLYVTNAGPNQLWRNNGDGTFTDSTAAAEPLREPRWSTSAAFLDFDHDGWLDLYVANYVDYRPETHKQCLNSGGAPEYCGPHSFPPETDRLLRNLGDGTFEDVTESAGLLSEPGSGLGVVSADLTGDGRIDIYVANDLMRNLLWVNQGDGTFINQALMAGTAVGLNGQAEASMGTDAGDLDNDGDFDLFMTHLDGETNTLYLNDGHGQFLDATSGGHLAEPSRSMTGFGTAMLDVDNDGWLDLVAVNGAVRSIDEQRSSGDILPLRQPNALFMNEHHGRFADASHRVPAFLQPEVSRGLSIGDVDNDGDVDLLVTNNHGPARLLINQVGQDSSWLGLSLRDRSGRPAQGGAVTVPLEASARMLRVGTDVSYCSARDPRVLIGLGGSASEPLAIEVLWVSGRRERFAGLEPRRYHDLIEGQGEALSSQGQP